MKNSLFKRAIAAAATVPLALTQCLTVANAVTINDVAATITGENAFTADDNVFTLNNGDATSLLFIDPSDDYVQEGDTFVKDSTWNKRIYDALIQVSATDKKTGIYDTADLYRTIILRAGSYEDVVSKVLNKVSDVNYNIVGAAAENGGDIEFTADIANVTSVFTEGGKATVGYALDKIASKYGAKEIKSDTSAFDNIVIAGKVKVVLHTSSLQTTTGSSVDVTFTDANGKSYKGVEIVNYATAQLEAISNAAKATIDKYAAQYNIDTEAAYKEIAKSTNDGVSYIKKAVNGVDDALAFSHSGSYATLSDAIKSVNTKLAKDGIKGHKSILGHKLQSPETATAIANNEKVLNAYNSILKRVSESFPSYTVNITANEAGAFADSLGSYTFGGENKAKDIKLDIAGGKGTATAVFDDAEKDSVVAYFAEKYPDVEVIDVYKEATVKVDFSTVKASVASGDLQIKRIVKTQPKTTTTTTTSTTTTTDTNVTTTTTTDVTSTTDVTTTTTSEGEIVTTTTTSEDGKIVSTTTTSGDGKIVSTTTTTDKVNPVSTTTTTDKVNPGSTTTTTSGKVNPVSTTTTTDKVNPGSTTTTTSGKVNPVTTTTTDKVSPGSTTTTTSGKVNPVTTTTTDKVNPGSTTTTTSGKVNPVTTTTTDKESLVSTTTTTSGKVNPGSTTTTTSGKVNPVTTTTTTDKVNPGSTTTTTSGKVNPVTTTTTDAIVTTTTTTDVTTDTTTTTTDVTTDTTTTTTDVTTDTTTTTTDVTTDTTTTTDVTTDTTTTTTDATTTTTTPTTSNPDENLAPSYAEYTTVNGFYFSHDPSKFSDEHVSTLKLFNEDGTEFEGDLSKITFADAKNGADNPMEAFTEPEFGDEITYETYAHKINVLYDGEVLTYEDGTPVQFTAFIGVKGDTDLDAAVNSQDASNVLAYYSKMSTSKDTSNIRFAPEVNALVNEYPELDNFCAFLADVDHDVYDEDNWSKVKSDREILADDASNILAYYVEMSTSTHGDRQIGWNKAVVGREEKIAPILNK